MFFFVRLNSIPWCVCIYMYIVYMYIYTYTFSSSIHPSMDIWIASTFCLLWIMLSWTRMHKSLWNSTFQCFEYLFRSGILDLTVIVCFILEEWSCCFPQQLYHLHSHQQGTRIPISQHSYQHLLFPAVCFILKCLFWWTNFC